MLQNVVCRSPAVRMAPALGIGTRGITSPGNAPKFPIANTAFGMTNKETSKDGWGGSMTKGIGSANLDWPSLGFDYVPTDGHMRYLYKDGEWDTGRFERDPYVSIHILANVFHYGQALFEGFKCFHTQDGSVCTFVDSMSYDRMAHGTKRFRMPMVPRAIWNQAINQVVKRNVAFIPPHGSGGAFYMRPFIFGSGPKLGLGPSPEYTFAIFGNPVGSYYQTGSLTPIDALVNDDYDRAAPLGCGDCKAAGNYAADLESMHKAKNMGFAISLYLDARERRYIEEFNTSNFVAITKDGKFITPNSPRTILASNTNRVVQQLALDMGVPVEVRQIDFAAEVDNFAEVGAVGTAVVLTPIKSLTRGGRKWEFGQPNVLQKLYDKVCGLQNGTEHDVHGFLRTVSLSEQKKTAMLSVYPGL